MLVAGSLDSAHANLLTNGSFEQANFTGGLFGFPLAQQLFSGDTTVTGWTVAKAELGHDPTSNVLETLARSRSPQPCPAGHLKGDESAIFRTLAALGREPAPEALHEPADPSA